MDQVQRKRRHGRQFARVRGTAKRPRVSVYRSNTALRVQFIDDTVGHVLLSGASEKNSIDKAVELGKKLADEAKKANIETIVFDRSGYQYHGRVKAFAEALREGGLVF